jgi:hypothetical protein
LETLGSTKRGGIGHGEEEEEEEEDDDDDE